MSKQKHLAPFYLRPFYGLKGFVRDRHNRFVSLLVVLVLVSISLIATVSGNAYYDGRFEPNTRLGSVVVGSLSASEALKNVRSELSHRSIEFVYEDQRVTLTPDQVGVSVHQADINKLAQKKLTQYFHPWFLGKEEAVPLYVDYSKLRDTLNSYFLLPDESEPINAKFIYKDRLQIQPDKSGYMIDVASVEEELVQKLQRGQLSVSISIPMKTVEAPIRQSELEEVAAEFQEVIRRTYKISGERDNTQFTEAEIFRWMKPETDGNSIKLIVDKSAVESDVRQAADEHYVPPVERIMQEYTSGISAKQQQAGVDGRKVTNVQYVAAELIIALRQRTPYQGAFEFESIPYQTRWQTIDDLSGA